VQVVQQKKQLNKEPINYISKRKISQRTNNLQMTVIFSTWFFVFVCKIVYCIYFSFFYISNIEYYYNSTLQFNQDHQASFFQTEQ